MRQVKAGIEANRAGAGRLSSLSDDLRDVVALRQRGVTQPIAIVECEESLIVDDRSGMSPAEMVENKLSRMLKDGSMPVSHLQTRKLLKPR
jgi:hypothetical protein